MPEPSLVNYLNANIWCRPAVSKVAGVGIVAIRAIPKGTCFHRGTPPGRGWTIYRDQLRRLNPGVRLLLRDYFAVEEDGSYTIPEVGLPLFDAGNLINHSSTSNVTTPDGGTTLYALRNIKAGEELVMDYGKALGVALWF